MNVYQGDPLARLLHDRLGVRSAWKFALVSAVAQLIQLGILVAMSFSFHGSLGWLLDQARLTSTAQIIGALLFGFLVTPVVWGAYVWFNAAPPRLFSELEGRELMAGITPESEAAALRATERVYQSPWWAIASSGIVAVFSIGTVVQPLVTDVGWKLPAALVGLVTWIPGWYMICMVAAREIATIVGLHHFFQRGHLLVIPLHPDRCGGLGPLNRFALGFTYLLATCAFGLVIVVMLSETSGDLARNYGLFVAILAFVVLAPSCFFLTLGTAHNSMSASKQALLHDLSVRFQREYAEVSGALRERRELAHERIEEVERLHVLYQLADSCPVWPFDGRSVRRFVSAMLAPVAPIPASIAAGVLLKWLGG